MKDALRCPIHPKYRGKKKPKFCTNVNCTCPEIYLKLKSKPRVLPRPTKVMKDKSKYNRKKKHKGSDE